MLVDIDQATARSLADSSGTVLFEDHDILVTDQYVVIGGRAVATPSITFAGSHCLFKPNPFNPELLFILGVYGLLVSAALLIGLLRRNSVPEPIEVLFGTAIMIGSAVMIALAFTVFRRRIHSFTVILIVDGAPIVLPVGPNKKMLEQVVDAIRKAMHASGVPRPQHASSHEESCIRADDRITSGPSKAGG